MIRGALAKPAGPQRFRSTSGDGEGHRPVGLRWADESASCETVFHSQVALVKKRLRGTVKS